LVGVNSWVCFSIILMVIVVLRLLYCCGGMCLIIVYVLVSVLIVCEVWLRCRFVLFSSDSVLVCYVRLLGLMMVSRLCVWLMVLF